jgi:hypothetical protein
VREAKLQDKLCLTDQARSDIADTQFLTHSASSTVDEKPGIQAIANTAPDLPPNPGVHATFARDHEYKRHGTISLLAGIDLLAGQVHALVRDRHRSCQFIEFLHLLDDAYPIRVSGRSLMHRAAPAMPAVAKGRWPRLFGRSRATMLRAGVLQLARSILGKRS